MNITNEQRFLLLSYIIYNNSKKMIKQNNQSDCEQEIKEKDEHIKNIKEKYLLLSDTFPSDEEIETIYHSEIEILLDNIENIISSQTNNTTKQKQLL